MNIAEQDIIASNADTKKLKTADLSDLDDGLAGADAPTGDKFVDDIRRAQRELNTFTLSALEKRLLDTACENVGTARGTGLDEQAKNEVLQRASLFAAYGNNLAKVLTQISDVVPHADCAGVVYSTCFAVGKATTFTTNLWFRQALDPADGEGTPAHDYRDRRDAPYGLGPDEPDAEADREIRQHESVRDAMVNVHIYLQLLTEAFGWDPENPMPYMFEQEKDGRFRPIHDPDQALDIQQVRAQASRAKRQERRSNAYAACLAGAKAALVNAAR